MTKVEAIEAISDQYRKDGYAVAVPPGAELASFLEMPDVDLIASKGDEIIAIDLDRREDLGARPVVVASGMRGGDFSLILLAEAEQLFTPNTRHATLLLAWTAFEVAAREVLSGDGGGEDQALVELIHELCRRGYLDPAEAEATRQGLYARNLIVHGVQPSKVKSEVIASLLDIVRELKRRDEPGSNRSRPAASSITPRGDSPEDSALSRWVAAASLLLDEVLGPARAQVSADWVEGKNSRDEPIVFLRLSDLNGIVGGSFFFDEIEQPAWMKTRMHQLWGKLLGFRVADQLANLANWKVDS